MADFQRNSLSDRDYEQAITTLKKGMYLLKYGRWGKPKFCPFWLSKLCCLESPLHELLAIFQRCPQPDKEHQSFSLICSNRSLDLDPRGSQTVSLLYEGSPQHRLEKAFSEILTYTSITKALTQTESVANHFSSLSLGGLDNSSVVDSFRSSLSSAVCSSTQ